jgi:hypothetical protein
MMEARAEREDYYGMAGAGSLAARMFRSDTSVVSS